MVVAFDFAKRAYIVTGGNRGIGHAISTAIAKAGGNVAVIYRSAKDAEEVTAKLASDHGIKAKAYQCDVGQEDKVEQTFKQIKEDFGTINGVVANAGVSIVKDATEMKYEDYKFVYDANVFGQFNCAKFAAKQWIADGFKEGSIIFVSSMSSQIVNRGIHQVFYNSSKAAASSIVKQLAVEWADHGIRINALCPGYVATDQTSHMDPKLLSWQKKELVPLQRFSEPHEQTGMVLLLLDPVMAAYMTGTEYFVDGGAQAW